LPGANPIALDATQSLSPQGAFDVAIRSGRGPWPGYESVRLLGDHGTPMLSPKWAPPGSRMTAKKLLRVPLIPDSRWAEWFRLAGVANAKPQFVAARFPNYELEALAAVQGIGAGQAVDPLRVDGGRSEQLLASLDQGVRSHKFSRLDKIAIRRRVISAPRMACQPCGPLHGRRQADVTIYATLMSLSK
jgi:hypothetical protein